MSLLKDAFSGLKLNNKKPVVKEKTHSLLNTRKEVTLCHTEKGVSVIMKPITEEEEIRIEKADKYYGELRYIQDDKHIRAKNIYVYGEVDVDNDDDLDIIERFNLIPKDGGWIYSNFDYDAGTFTTIEGRLKGAPTYNPITWFLYNYVKIGKPKRIIIYINEFIKLK